MRSSSWSGLGDRISHALTGAFLLLAVLLLALLLLPPGDPAPPEPPGTPCSKEGLDETTQRWCKRIDAIRHDNVSAALKEAQKESGAVEPPFRPTGDVYAMRVRSFLSRPVTGPLTDRPEFPELRRKFVAAALTYDLTARIARLRLIESDAASPPIARHRALIEIAASIIRANDPTRTGEARRALEAALRINVSVPALHADVHFLSARLDRISGQPARALAALDKAVTLDRYFFHAHLERVRIAMALEGEASEDERQRLLETGLQAADVVLALDDTSYLLELEQLLGRTRARTSMIGPFITLVVAAARRDGAAFDAVHASLATTCTARSRSCPAALARKLADLRELRARWP